MRWPRKRKIDERSVEAVLAAQANLDSTRERTTEVHEVTSALRRLREKNHFAEQLQYIMGGPR